LHEIFVDVPRVLLAYAGFVLAGLSAGVSGVLLPAQIDDYGVDKAVVGLTFFTFSAGFLLAGAAAGPLLHRFGMRATLVFGGVAVVASWLYLASRPAFVALVLVQVVAGFGTGVLESVLNVYLAGLPRATTLLNRLHAFFGVGALLGPLLAAWMLGFTRWPMVYLVLAVVAVPVVTGYLLTYPRQEPPAEGDRPALLSHAVRVPAVLLAGTFLTVYVGLEIGVGNWAYSLLTEEHGQGPLLAGWSVSGYWLGLTLGRFIISPVAGRVGLSAAGTSFVCLVGVTGAALLGWLVPAGAVATVALVVMGCFLGPLFPTAIAVMPDVVEPRLVPTAIGVINGFSVLGGALFPWLAGALAQGVGVWTLMPFATVLAVAQLLVWRQVVARMRIPQRPSGAAT
jgi:fucose permease